MLEQIVLGLIQGIAEWLPVSSEGMILLAETHLFHRTGDIASLVHAALFLHLGTLASALIYFHKDVGRLFRALFRFRSSSAEEKATISFLLTATLISGALGILLLKLLVQFSGQFLSFAKFLTFVIALCLLATGYLQLRARDGGKKNAGDLTWVDAVILGVAQGFAALPGLSRSGLTVSAFLLRKFDKTESLRLSFIMSIPIILAGNILLNLGNFSFSAEALAGFLFSFGSGLATIHLLLSAARKINFGHFVLFFAAILLAIAVFL